MVKLAIFFFVCAISMHGFAQTSTPPMGSGTSGDPYLIATLDNLYWLSQTTSAWEAGKYFKQTSDLDASSTSGWASGAGFSPIGNSTTYFQGHYNGDGHKISNLFINRPTTDYVGLFGQLQYGTIQKLGVTDVNITGGTYYVGALVGMFARDGAQINYCYSSGTINSHNRTGGLVGEKISGTPYIGNCYSSVTVNADGQYVGGLVGTHISGTLENSYSVGSVTGSSSVGGLTGANFGVVTNSFWDTQTSGQSVSGGGTGKTTAEMKTQSTFTNAGWNFSTVWAMNGTNYPSLQEVPDGHLPIQLASFTGSVMNNGILLQWTTISEVNNYGFFVQKRFSSELEWGELAGSFIAGHGTTNVPQHYSVTDHAGIATAVQYRLKQIDLDGTVHFTEPILVAAATSVKEEAPMDFALQQNYPNPFNPTTSIAFSLPTDAQVTLEVFDLLGSRVTELVSGTTRAGYHSVVFDASKLSSGAYYYMLKAGNYVATRKLLLVR